MDFTARFLPSGRRACRVIFSLAATVIALPYAIAGGSPVSQDGLEKIAPGEYQCFYLVNGRVRGVGSNRTGELGIGFGSSLPGVPAVDAKLPSDVRFVDVAAGGYHGLALDSTGRVWTWGSNAFGQRGDGSPVEQPGVPLKDDGGLPAIIPTDIAGNAFGDVVQIEAGLCADVALKRDGTVWVWGQNSAECAGLAGNGDVATAFIQRPSQVVFQPGVHIVQVSMNSHFVMGRDSEGRVWSWGGGADSKEDRGSDTGDFGRPHRVLNLPPVQDVCAGDRFAYALDANGDLWGWGAEGTYLGLGQPEGGWFPQGLPKKLDFPEFGGLKVKQVAVSAHSTHVILSDGSLWGWGDSALGEVGNGRVLDFSRRNYTWDWHKFDLMMFRPVRIAPEEHNFKTIYSHALCFYCYAMTADGRIFSWGRNKTGILGNDVLPSGDQANHPDSWNVALATEVSPLTVKRARSVPSKP
jgi:alpha-tubulin suppressor-like RCC1 family protein